MLRTSLLALVAFAFLPGTASAAESYDGCTGYIDTLPAVISKQGTWCLRKDLSTPLTSGRAITISASFVNIDCNGYKIGNLQAGTASGTYGIYSRNTLDVRVLDCNIRGFLSGIDFVGGPSGGGYVVEDNLVQGALNVGVRVEGLGSTVRGNTVSDIGGSTLVADAPRGILTAQDVDVIDNTVASVAGKQATYGIYTNANDSGSIIGNRVRGIVRTTGYDAVGIYNAGTTRVVIRNNDVVSSGATIGIRCGTSKGRARGNVVRGFATGISVCGDAGRNHVSP